MKYIPSFTSLFRKVLESIRKKIRSILSQTYEYPKPRCLNSLLHREIQRLKAILEVSITRSYYIQKTIRYVSEYQNILMFVKKKVVVEVLTIFFFKIRLN